MYEFLTGPFLWFSFIVCFFGFIIRFIYLFSLSRVRDRVIYNHVSLAWGLKSIFHWIVPFASHAMRSQPVFTIMGFAFHVSLISVPIFFSAHNILWDEGFSLSLWHFPDFISDALTLVVIISGSFLLARRIVRPEVRVLTEVKDYALLVLTLLPFVTGFLAFHQIGPYDVLFILHVMAGGLFLILLPFTKLSHMIFFFFTRLFMGFEMGGRRGARPW